MRGTEVPVCTEKPIALSISACVMTVEGVEEPAETDDFAFPTGD